MTTRVRINIPGSRPIPPVVMRKPMGESRSGAAGEPDRADRDTGGAGSRPSASTAGGSARAAGDDGEGGQGTSDWFAPRRSSRPTAGHGGPGADVTGPGGTDGRGRGYFPDEDADAAELLGHPHTPPDGFPAVPGAGTTGGFRSSLADLDGLPQRTPASSTTGPGNGGMTLPQRRSATRDADWTEPSVPLGAVSGLSAFSASDRERLSGDTLVGSIPPVPAGARDPFPPVPDPYGDDHDDLDHDDAPPSRGRNKLVLVGVGLITVLGIAYGAGLLLDHSEVPKGTTVLGIEIGGTDKQSATNTLRTALGDRTTAPLTVVVNGEETELKPSVAGLSIDAEATVREAAGRDYNPVSVIGSLVGGSRGAEAAVVVDEEKLTAALTSLTGGGGDGAPKDGMVRFKNGKAVAVPGVPHEGVDLNRAASVIEDAYRDRAATGESGPVNLPVTTQQPRISGRALQSAVDGFGRTAMSGWVWLRAGDVEVPFSERTIGTFLTMRPGGGKLQPVIDTETMAKAYGAAFDGVVIDAGAGTVPMTPQHAAAAMLQALKKTAPPEPDKRVAQVEASRSG